MSEDIGSIIAQGLQGLNQGIFSATQIWQMAERNKMARRAMERQDAMAQGQLGLMRANLALKERELAGDDEFYKSISPWLSPGGGTFLQQPGNGVAGDSSQSSRPVTGWGANNPGNIRPVGGQGFNSYATPLDGARAMSDLLNTYATKHGVNSLIGLTSRWAPKGDGNNDPAAYAGFLSKQIGDYPVDAPIDLTNPEFRAKIMQAMSQMETGRAMPPEMATQAVGGNFPMGPQLASRGGVASDMPNGGGIDPNATIPVGNRQYRLAELAKDAGFVSLVGMMAPRSKAAAGLLSTLKTVREMTEPRKLDGAQAYEARFGRRFDPSETGAAAWVKSYNQANSTQTVNVHNNLPPEQNALQKKQGESVQAAREQIAKDADAGLKTLATLKYAEPLLNSSGSLAEVKKVVGGMAQGLGLDSQFKGFIDAANDINTLQALSARMLLPIVQNTTAFHTNFSDADRRSIESMNISPQNLPEVNRRLMEMVRKEAALALEKQKKFTGLKDYADYESRLTEWNQTQAARIQEEQGRGLAPAPSDANAGPTASASPTYKDAEDVRRDYQAGRITADQAESILKSQFGME